MLSRSATKRRRKNNRRIVLWSCIACLGSIVASSSLSTTATPWRTLCGIVFDSFKTGNNYDRQLAGTSIGKVRGKGRRLFSEGDFAYGKEEEEEEAEHGQEEEEEVHHHEEDEEEEKHQEFLKYTSVTCVILVLNIITIAFEEAKDQILEHSDRTTMRPIISCMFGEMTVLGFVSIFSYILVMTGVFDSMGVAIFGEEEKKELMEIFETVHYCLFFIMIFFICQVLKLVKHGEKTEEVWIEMDDKCRLFESHMDEYDYSNNDASIHNNSDYHFDTIMNKINSKSGSKNKKYKPQDFKLFLTLRSEFIKERSVNEPFLPTQFRHRVPENFSFGRYLCICQSNLLKHAVHIGVVSWVFFMSLTVLFYVTYLAFNKNAVPMAWIWTALGWLELYLVHFLEDHLVKIRDAFCSSDTSYLEQVLPIVPLSSSKDVDNHTSNEKTSLLNGSESHEEEKLDTTLPAWCHIDIDKYNANKTKLERWFLGDAEINRHHALFWFEKYGPSAYMSCMRIIGLFTGVYIALLVVSFIPTMYTHCEEEETTWLFILYCILSALPLVVFFLREGSLFALLTVVSSIGIFRRPQAVSAVVREQKTKRIVRAFIILYKVRRAAEKASEGRPQEKTLKRKMSSSFDKVEMKEIRASFHAFDRSETGTLDESDFKKIMESLNIPMDEESIRRMIETLDHHDGDGVVSLEEFVEWYEASLKEVVDPEDLFEMFDTNGSGDVTIGEFKTSLDAFNMNFSVDEIGELVMELDEDGNGMIGEEEFADLLRKFYPQEVKTRKRRRSSLFM